MLIKLFSTFLVLFFNYTYSDDVASDTTSEFVVDEDMKPVVKARPSFTSRTCSCIKNTASSCKGKLQSGVYWLASFFTKKSDSHELYFKFDLSNSKSKKLIDYSVQKIECIRSADGYVKITQIAFNNERTLDLSDLQMKAMFSDTNDLITSVKLDKSIISGESIELIKLFVEKNKDYVSLCSNGALNITFNNEVAFTNFACEVLTRLITQVSCDDAPVILLSVLLLMEGFTDLKLKKALPIEVDFDLVKSRAVVYLPDQYEQI